MFKLIGFGVLGLLGGFIAAALTGGLLVHLLSSNSHDKAQEVSTTALLVFGPLGALAGAVGAVVYALRTQG